MSKVCDKVYIDAEGKENRSATVDAVSLAFRFKNGSEVVVDFGKLPKEIIQAAAKHGVAQKIGDTYAGAETVDEAVERAEAMLESLMTGTWISGRQATGPRIGTLLDAIVAAKAAAGQEADRNAIEAKLKGDEALRKNALKNPAIKAEYDRIQAARAAERAKASAKEAKGSEADLSAF